MAVNATGTFRRTADDEDEDFDQAAQNLLDKAWKNWPNEAGFDNLDEHRGPLPLTVKGSMPAYCAGNLYRTGPGQSSIDDTPHGTHFVSHWFDGFAHTHRFDLVPDEASGKVAVEYSSRRHSEEFVARVKKQGWRASISFGQRADPCVGLFAKAMSTFDRDPRANNNVAMLPNAPGFPSQRKPDAVGHRAGPKNLFVATDNSTMQELDPVTMESLGYTTQQTLHPDLKGPLSCAHSQRDPFTGDVFNFNLDLVGSAPTYRMFRINADTGTTDILATISAGDGAHAAYIHSFFLSENYVTLCVPSSHYSWNGLSIPFKRSLLEAILPFDESQYTRWVVVDRRPGKSGIVARFSTPASFFFHSVNAFEEPSSDEKETDLCLDLVQFDTTDILESYYYDVILDRNDATSKYLLRDDRHRKLQPRFVRYRYTLPSDPTEAAQTASEVLSILSPHVGELPSINPAYTCRPYRYVYSAPSRGMCVVMDALCKTDLETQEALIWAGPRGHSPGEPIFVGNPAGEDEDDGVVLSVVLDGENERSYLLCLDAKTMTELGRAEADFAIGVGFHGVHERIV